MLVARVLFELITALRVQIAVLLVFLFLLAAPQAWELLAIETERPPWINALGIFVFSILFLLLSAIQLQCLTKSAAFSRLNTLSNSAWGRTLAYRSGMAIAFATVVFSPYFMILHGQLSDWSQLQPNALAIGAGAGLGMLAFLLLSSRIPRVIDGLRSASAARTTTIIAALAALLLSLVQMYKPDLVIGIPAHVFLMLAAFCWIAIGQSLSVMALSVGAPLFLGLLVWSGIIGVGFYDRSHKVPLLPPRDAAAPNVAVPPLVQAFAQWLASRPDRDQFLLIDKPYPVFLVAAEGGGSYAAVHAANTLSQLQSANGSFASHVFAISSVSGGTVGAAGFVSELKEAAQLKRPFSRDRVMAFVTADFISPLIGGALFADAFQRFLPLFGAQADRSRQFEFALSDAWCDSAERVALECQSDGDGNLFEDDFHAHWMPDSAYPALMANTTIEFGAPYVATPLHTFPARENDDRIGTGQIQLLPLAGLLPAAEECPGYDSGTKCSHRISFGTVVGLSARFPYVFAPAVIDFGTKWRVVDGGYFDDTGISNAALLHDILTNHRTKIEELVRGLTGSGFTWDIHLIVIGSFENPPIGEVSGFLSDTLTPVRTVANTRRFRTSNTHRALDQRRFSYERFMLNPDSEPFPLGFALGQRTVDRIVARGGTPAQCSDEDYARQMREDQKKNPKTEAGIRLRNSCRMKHVARMISAKSGGEGGGR